MRKAWLLLLVVALTAVGVSAFADGTWTAWNQGNFYPYISFNGYNNVPGWGPNYDTNGGIDQEWTFAYAGKNYGFDMTTEFGNTARPQARRSAGSAGSGLGTSSLTSSRSKWGCPGSTTSRSSPQSKVPTSLVGAIRTGVATCPLPRWQDSKSAPQCTFLVTAPPFSAWRRKPWDNPTSG